MTINGRMQSLDKIFQVDCGYGKRHLGGNIKARLQEIEVELSAQGIVNLEQNYKWRMWLNRRLASLI